MLCDPRVGLWRPGGSYSARRLVPGYFRAHGRLARALPANGWRLSYAVACYESEGFGTTDLSSVTLSTAEKLGCWPFSGRGGCHCPVGLAPPRPL